MTEREVILEGSTAEDAAAVDAPTAEVPAPPPPAGLLEAAGGTIPRARAPGALLTHGGITIGQFFGTQVIGLAFPLAAGALFYGWRAILAIAIVLGAALGATAIWRRVAWRGQHLRYPHVAWLALLLALTLPAHLASGAFAVENKIITPWPLL